MGIMNFILANACLGSRPLLLPRLLPPPPCPYPTTTPSPSRTFRVWLLRPPSSTPFPSLPCSNHACSALSSPHLFAPRETTSLHTWLKQPQLEEVVAAAAAGAAVALVAVRHRAWAIFPLSTLVFLLICTSLGARTRPLRGELPQAFRAVGQIFNSRIEHESESGSCPENLIDVAVELSLQAQGDELKDLDSKALPNSTIDVWSESVEEGSSTFEFRGRHTRTNAPSSEEHHLLHAGTKTLFGTGEKGSLQGKEGRGFEIKRDRWHSLDQVGLEGGAVSSKLTELPTVVILASNHDFQSQNSDNMEDLIVGVGQVQSRQGAGGKRNFGVSEVQYTGNQQRTERKRDLTRARTGEIFHEHSWSDISRRLSQGKEGSSDCGNARYLEVFGNESPLYSFESPTNERIVLKSAQDEILDQFSSGDQGYVGHTDSTNQDIRSGRKPLRSDDEDMDYGRRLKNTQDGGDSNGERILWGEAVQRLNDEEGFTNTYQRSDDQWEAGVGSRWRVSDRKSLQKREGLTPSADPGEPDGRVSQKLPVRMQQVQNRQEEDFQRLMDEAEALLNEGKEGLEGKIEVGVAERMLYEASDLFASATAMDPSSLEAVGSWGNTLLSHGQLKLLLSKQLRSMLPSDDSPWTYNSRRKGMSEDWRRKDMENAAIEQTLQAVYEECEDLLLEAGRKYRMALLIDRDDIRALYNWGLALCFRAQLITDEGGEDAAPKADKVYLAAIDKFEAMMGINQTYAPGALLNWGLALRDRSHLLPMGSRERIKLLQQAKQLFQDAFNFDPNYSQARGAIAACTAELKELQDYEEAQSERDKRPRLKTWRTWE